MKYQLHKSVFAILIIILFIGLAGCATSESSKKVEAGKKATTTEVKKDDKKHLEAKESNPQDQSVTATNQQNNQPANGQDTQSAKPATGQAIANTGSDTQPAQPSKSKPSTTTNTAAAQQTTPQAPATQPATQTVKISIVVPGDQGTILNWKSVDINENETIFDVLIKAIGEKRVEYRGSGSTTYVSGIDDYYERDKKYGALSGWICKLNGAGITKSAGAIKVNAGDQIEWIYKED